VSLEIADDNQELLKAVSEIATSQIDGDRHYLTAYNGETWNGGFDLPFCRTRFLNHDMDWPFDDLAYADMMEAIVDRFDTGDKRDLAHDSSNLMKANEEFHQLLVRGKRFTVTSEEGKETKRIFVRLVDLRDIENNRFVAADEFRVKRGGNSIRPDVNLFVNGIPLVTMELKSLAQENDYYDAISDLQDYEEDVSRLFVPNLWNVAADSMAYRYGAVGASSSFYMPWKADEDETPSQYHVGEEANPLKESVLAMCNHETLLDVLRNFVFYEDRTGGTTKIIPRHMQYYAANRIVDRVREGRSDEAMRRGLIWCRRRSIPLAGGQSRSRWTATACHLRLSHCWVRPN
jgi:type I restriction enzyme R subunit